MTHQTSSERVITFSHLFHRLKEGGGDPSLFSFFHTGSLFRRLGARQSQSRSPRREEPRRETATETAVAIRGTPQPHTSRCILSTTLYAPTTNPDPDFSESCEVARPRNEEWRVILLSATLRGRVASLGEKESRCRDIGRKREREREGNILIGNGRP